MQEKLVTSSLVLLTFLVASGCTVAVAATASLQFESQALDLETGVILERGLGDPSWPAEADVYLAFNADRSTRAVLISLGVGAEISFMEGSAFDTVTAADVPNLDFSLTPPDKALASADTVVIRTPDGAVFKLGNTVESEDSATFDYERLQ